MTARHVQRRLCDCRGHAGCRHHMRCPSPAMRGTDHCPACDNRRRVAVSRGMQVLTTRRPQDALEDR